MARSNKISSTSNALHQLEEFYHQNNLAFFLGAGASIDAGVPSPAKIIQAVLRALSSDRHCDAHPPLAMQNILNEIQIDQLRLEAVLGSIDSHQISAKPFNYYTGEIVRSVCDGRLPESLHRLLAKQLSSGTVRTIFTTNWDSLIESTLSSPVNVVWDKKSWLPESTTKQLVYLKLHGTAPTSQDSNELTKRKARSIVADIAGISGILNKAVEKQAQDSLGDKEQAWCFVGYSGRDPDIHRLFINKDLKVFWLLHAGSDDAKNKETINAVECGFKGNKIYFFKASIEELTSCLGDSSTSTNSAHPTLDLSGVFSGISFPDRLNAVGLALGHAGLSPLANHCFTLAGQMDRRNVVAEFGVMKETSHIYRSWYGLIAALWLLRRLNLGKLRRAECWYFVLLAVENLRIGVRLWPLTRPIAAIVYRFLPFKLNRAKRRLHSYRSKRGDYALRTIALRIDSNLGSVRCDWSLSPRTVSRRLHSALRLARYAGSAQLQGHAWRYKGRWLGIFRKRAQADRCFLRAEREFLLVSDLNGVTEVAKYRLKNAIASMPTIFDQKTADDLKKSADSFRKTYENQREHVPPYAVAATLWPRFESLSWRYRFTLRIWRWSLGKRFSF